jgi:hypothetical protein
VWLAAFAVWLAAALPAAAHLTPNSEIRLDIGRDMVSAELLIPLGELGYAVGRPIPGRLGPAPAELNAYVTPRVAVRSPDGRAWSIRLVGARIVADAGGPDYLAQFALTPPPGAALRQFDLTDRAVIDRVRNHFVLVLVRTDYAGGQLSEQPRLLGGLQWDAQTLRIDRGPASAWRGFGSAVGLGMRHIAEGHDHLLFLLALLLPAPLIARDRRWRDFGGLGFTVRRLAGVVTAFTLGHSVTLIGGAFLGWRLPAQPVEVMIAVSILVSAVHAARPLFAGREPAVAAGFGLVHGLAFATVIGHFGLDPLEKAQSILGFNLGIELVQLAVVAAVMPPLALLARTRSYTAVRPAAAALCGAAALAWIDQRTVGAGGGLGDIVDVALSYAPWAYPLLILGALTAAWADRRHTQPAADPVASSRT